ncbi:pathogenesis-related protein [Colletotrichum sojae]|uniref:Pathogenesis-related protein n=1 Tax=Colletotrichum sojae TaxID=2175907 RepID=A0A8H6J139_9PEZI|nr:pathogenesis-related protein [Colletotrichum sojae]
MRFSAVVAAAMATNAAAWQPRPNGYWGWGPGRWSGVSTVTLAPTAVPVPATTPAAAVPTPAPVAEEQDLPQVTSTPVAAAASSTPAASAAGLTADQQKALDAHNSARSDVGVPALTWDATLAKNAQDWADHLISVGSLTHSQTSGEGENLYMQSGGSTPNANAADAWLGEKSLYNGEAISATNYMGFGHYTQAVWKSTTKVGMAIATDSKGATYVVARYSPPGN